MLLLKHRLPAWLWQGLSRLRGAAPRSPGSVVIPCVGADYVEEATLAAAFAARSLPEVQEIIIATDQPSEKFFKLPTKVLVQTVNARLTVPRAYEQIWQSRVIKIQAPLFARHDVVLLMDSDMNLLRDLRVAVQPGVVLGSFRRGRMADKVKNRPECRDELKGTRRPFLKSHLNGAFLVAHRKTWERLSREWLNLYETIWDRITEGQPPTDQLPLAIALDRLRLATVDLGVWANWSVAKNIGGRPATIPPQVIGAHGGFPLSEWQKYLADPKAALNFHGQDYTRKERYKE